MAISNQAPRYTSIEGLQRLWTIRKPTTLHFHGVRVPNSMDGVPVFNAEKSSSFVRCTAKRAAFPATSGGYSM